MNRKLAAAVIAVVSYLGLTGAVSAHGGLDSADPPIAADIDGPVDSITLNFPVEVEGVKLSVIEPDGTHTAVVTSETLAAVHTFAVDTGHAAGEHVVTYQGMIPGDDHVLTGGYAFTINPPDGGVDGIIDMALYAAIAAGIAVIGYLVYVNFRQRANEHTPDSLAEHEDVP